MKRPMFIVYCVLFCALIFGINYVRFIIWKKIHPGVSSWYFIFSGK